MLTRIRELATGCEYVRGEPMNADAAMRLLTEARLEAAT
jgi:hypothetical protein